MGAMKKIQNIEDSMTKITQDMFEFAEYDEGAAERTGYSNYSYWASTWRVFTKNKVAMFFLTLLAALMLLPLFSRTCRHRKIPLKFTSMKKPANRTGTSRPAENTGSEPIPSVRTSGPESGAVPEHPCSSDLRWDCGTPLWELSSVPSGAM